MSNRLNRSQSCSLAAKASFTLSCMSRNIVSRSRDVIIKDVLEVQTPRAGKEEIVLHHDPLITF